MVSTTAPPPRLANYAPGSENNKWRFGLKVQVKKPEDKRVPTKVISATRFF